MFFSGSNQVSTGSVNGTLLCKTDSMKLRKNIRNPNFILALISYSLFLAGVILLANNLDLGRLIIISSLIIGGIHWIVSIIDVITDSSLKNHESRYFWLAIVIMVPPIAGILYYLTEDKKFSY
jgi:hypothetical protein